MKSISFKPVQFVIVIASILALALVIAIATETSQITADPQPNAVGDKRQLDFGEKTSRIESSDRKLAQRERKEINDLKRELSTPRATRQREKSRTAFRDLPAEKAREVVISEQPRSIDPLWTPPPVEKGEKIIGFSSEHTARLKMPNSEREAIVESTYEPIAVETEEGAFKPVDLGLRPSAGGFVPERTKVPVKFPASSTEPVNFGSDALGTARLRLGGANSTGELVGDSAKLFYPNTYADTDTIVEALPLGAAVSWALRSPKSPQLLPLEFDLPFDGKFEKLDDGGVTFDAGPLGVAEIAPPVVYDAQGQSIDAEYRLQRNTVSVSVNHRARSIAYPVIVDPAINFGGILAFRDDLGYNQYGEPRPVSNSTSFAPFPFSTNNWTNMLYSTAVEGTGNRMRVSVRNGARGSAWANLVYDPPNSSTAFRVHFVSVDHANYYTELRAGIVSWAGAWESQKVGWTGGSCGDPNGCWAFGPYFGNNGGMPRADVHACTGSTCGMAGSGNNLVLMQYLFNLPSSAPSVSGSPSISTRGAYIYLSDYSAPTLQVTNVPNSQWANHATRQMGVSVNDNGGVGLGNTQLTDPYGQPYVAGSAFNMFVDDSSAGTLVAGISSGVGPTCTGGVSSPCVTTFGHTIVGIPHEGIRNFRFRASDIVGQATEQTATIKTDNSGPELSISGRLGAIALDAASIGTAEPRTMVNNTPFTIQAVDGRRLLPNGNAAPNRDRRSGVKDVTARFYGSNTNGTINLANEVTGVIDNAGTKQNSASECDTNTHPGTADDSCKITYTGALNASSLAPGIYYFRLTATDWAGNPSTKDFKVGVGSASLDTIVEGQATSRYVPIRIKRERGSSTSASLQFRTMLNKGWCAIPASATRYENDPLTNAAAQLPFDSNGLTTTVIVDLDGLRKLDDSGGSACVHNANLPRLDDGMVYVRGLVSGSESQSIRASEDVGIRYERGGLGTENDTADLGVGTVDLVSGNLSISATDVSIDAYKSDLTVSRTFNSRYAATKTGPFGPGWEIGLSSESMGADYEKVTDQADVDIPELDRYPAVYVESADGSTMTFELDEAAGTYKAEAGFEALKLERIPDAYDPTRSAGFKLTDLESGTVASFSTRSATTPAGEFKLTDVYEPSTNDKVTYAFGQSSTIGNYPTYAFAPSAGLSCRDANEGAQESYDTLPRGCQSLKFNYDLNGDRRLVSITLKTYDPATSGMVETTVAQYAYNASRQLVEAWDPRLSTLLPTPTHLKTTYNYLSSTDHRVNWVTPPGEQTYLIYYLKLPEESTYGRVNAVHRSALGAGTAIWTVRFFVPTTGSNAPFDFGVAETSKWGQERPPFMASAVFPPDQPPNGTPATNYDRASMSYLDPLGREVNTREPGGRIATTEYDKWGNVTRTLTPENRARAIALATPAERLAASEKWDTQHTYEEVPGSGDGRRHLTASVGPERAVRLDNGTEADARTHTRYTYDEGISPDTETGEPFDLVTTERVSALVGTTDHDVRTTTTNYGTSQSDWKLRIPREVVTDSGSGNLNIIRKVDVNADGMETARYQPRSQNSAEPSTTKTIYWSANTNPDDADCGGKPEWLGLTCKMLPGAQPTTSGLAELPVKMFTYNALRQPLATTETVVDASGTTRTRTTTVTYDAAGRVLTESITGGIGEPVRTTKHVYNAATGREIQTQSLNSNGTVYKTISRTYDSLGRQTAYTDAEGHSSTTTYDLLSRVATTNDGKATRTNTYDPITGDLTGVNDSGIGTITATYDADGRILTTMLPGGMFKQFQYSESGFQDYVSYTKTSNCSSSCMVFENWAKESAHGQIRELWQDIIPQGQTLKETAYEYRYDKAGRLTEVGDWRNDSGTWKCNVREYTLDADSNRTAKKTIADQNYYCDFGASGTTQTSTYDNADRITDSGYTNDAFGRITTTPESAAGGIGNFDATYYTNDLARTVSQNGTTQTLAIDPEMRMTWKSKVTGGNTATETYAYTDDSDSPAWIQIGSTSANWQRYVGGIDGAAGVQNSSGSAEYYFVNLRGDVVANGFPDPVEVSDVDEFGVPKTDLPASRRYGFHGSNQREALTSQGMIAMGVRLYAPRTGRFLQVDPVLSGSEGPYEYAHQDPVNIDDLDGRCPICGLAARAAAKYAKAKRKVAMKYAGRKAVEAARYVAVKAYGKRKVNNFTKKVNSYKKAVTKKVNHYQRKVGTLESRYPKTAKVVKFGYKLYTMRKPDLP